MKSIRRINVPRLIENEYVGHKKPKYSIGRYSRIWAGDYEDFECSIKEIRYNENYEMFEYLTSYGWIKENNLV